MEPVPAPRRTPWAILAATLGASACVAPDPWDDLRATCELEDGETLGWAAIYRAPDGGLNRLSISTDCGEALLRSIGGDPEALLQEVGGDVNGVADWGTHLEHVRLGARRLDGVSIAVWGLYWLLGGDHGEVGALRAGPYMAESWVSRLSARADALALDASAPLGRVLLAELTGRAADVAISPDDVHDQAIMAMRGWPVDTLLVQRFPDVSLDWVTNPWRPDVAAASLVHETQHTGLGGIPHVQCEAPAELTGRHCDAGLEGAFGAAFLARWAGVQAALDGADCVPADDELVRYTAFTTERDIRAAWSAVLMAAPPEEQLVLCD